MAAVTFNEKVFPEEKLAVSPQQLPEPPAEDGEKTRSRRWAHFALHLVICLAWLGPAIALLVLNFQSHLVGASIGCFSCRVNPFSSSTYDEEAGFNKRDDTALSGLQFAAKALEIWFALVGAGFIYDILVIITAHRGHLPIGMFAKYLQFGDILSIFQFPPGSKNSLHWGFIFFVGCMCVIMNLIGPAIAILMIPTLQWIDIDSTNPVLFVSLASSSPPSSVAISPGCSASLLAAGNFSCTTEPYAHTLDELFASVAASLGQIDVTPVVFDPVITQEGQVSYIVNTTDPDVDWIPSRQVAREISADYLRYANAVQEAHPPSNYSTIHNSLSTLLLRDGPVLGLGGGCYKGNLSVAQVAVDKSIRCYSGWNLFAISNAEYIKCIRVGTGWTGTTNFQSNLYLGTENSTVNDVAITPHFADHAHTPVSTDDPHCFDANGNPQTDPACDWDAIFAETPAANLWNTSTNFILVEYHMPGLSTPNNTVWCDDISYINFQSYELDPSPYSNFIHLATLEDADPPVPPRTVPLVVHPDWILAAWSVDQNGTVAGTRDPAAQISSTLETVLTEANATLELDLLNYMDGVVMDQALSLIDYSTNSSTQTTNAATNPLLTTSAQIQVWMYSMFSQTSKLGAAVVIICCVIVVLRILVAFKRATIGHYTSPKTLMELLLEALEYDPMEPDSQLQPRRASVGIMENKMGVKVDGRKLSFAYTH